MDFSLASTQASALATSLVVVPQYWAAMGLMVEFQKVIRHDLLTLAFLETVRNKKMLPANNKAEVH